MYTCYNDVLRVFWVIEFNLRKSVIYKKFSNIDSYKNLKILYF